jgi:eukaryotic-like serine/threonine-protein kinase
VASIRVTEQLGRVLGGRYRLVAPIGRGASAQVFLAHDVGLRRPVAVKVLHPALAGDDAFLRRFLAEAQSAARLSHPHVLAVHDWGDDDGPYLVSELLAGGSLRALLDTGARLSLAQAAAVGLQAARGLDAAHRQGIVHRDIKPANLLFGDDERLRIGDFGLARALSEAAWTDPGGALVGTARYAAPEQVTGGRSGARSDVYALGLVLIEAVTGAVPLTADTTIGTLMGRVGTPVPVPAALGPLREVLERCGRPEPEERPDAAELAEALLRASWELDRPEPLPLAGALDPAAATEVDPTLLPPSPDPPAAGTGPDADAVPSPPPTVARGATARRADRSRRRSRRRRRPWAVALLLVLVAAVGGTWAYLEARPARALVPVVSNMTRGEAEAALARAQAEAEGEVRWEVEVEAEHSDRVLEGVVLRQDPVGVELADGGVVTIVVSLGLPFRPVPDVAGETQEEAAARLAEAELALGAVTTEHDEEAPEGTVLDWRDGDEVRPVEVRQGTEIDLVVSAGPAPRTVPDLSGQSPDDASARLEELGLVATSSEEFSDDVPAGEVVGTEPGAGASVERGAEVVLRVSRGPDLVTVPDVGGLGLEAAVAALEGAGLDVGEVSGSARGAVATTAPSLGSSVRRGTVVDIELE